MTWQSEILSLLDEGYNDGGCVTPLDVEVAEAIERWAITKVSLFVHAAGGRVTVPLRDWIDPPSLTLYRLTDQLDEVFVTKTNDKGKTDGQALRSEQGPQEVGGGARPGEGQPDPGADT